MQALLVVALASGLLAIWVVLAQRRGQRVTRAQPARAESLRQEAIELGFVDRDDGWVSSSPLGVVSLELWDVRGRDDEDAFVSLRAPRAMSRHAYLQIVLPVAALPFEMSLYERDLFLRRRGLEAELPRPFRRAYHLAAPRSRRELVSAWARAQCDALLRLRPSRVYARACHCGRGHSSHLEIILHLARFERGQLRLALELLAGLVGRPTRPYR